MRDSFLRSSPSHPSSEESLLARIRANLRETLRPAHWPMTSANGAPLHLLETKRSPGASRAQSMSVLTHAAVIAILALLAIRSTPAIFKPEGATQISDRFRYPPRFLEHLAAGHPSLGHGSGAGSQLLPARSGQPAPISAIQLLRPTIPTAQEHVLPVEPTLLDPKAPPILTTVSRIGIPGHPDTDSAGRSKGRTIGDGGGTTMGDGGKDSTGVGNDPDAYRLAATMPTCLYCPTPAYTDEARETKLQGMVTVLALVNAEGRATDIRIAKGLGSGLDERARESVRAWRFTPARDAARHPVATWVTIEVVFRLF